mgnify:CR=1 FL=1
MYILWGAPDRSSVDVHLFGAYLSMMIARSKTFPRAAHPNLHRRCNRLLQVAARKVSAEPKVQRLLRAQRVNRVALDSY